MAKIAKPQELDVGREGNLVVLHIQGGGVLRMPADAAHGLARALMNQVGEVNRIYPEGPWPNLKTK